MTSARSTSVATIAVLTVVGGLVAYAVYFDYKRRNDPTFRKKLRKCKSKRRAEKVASESTPDVSSSGVPPEELREALQQIKQQPLPTKPEELESLFMSQISMGEGLAVQGPSFYLQSALCFYRALSVYPAPLELIVIYQKTLQPPVFEVYGWPPWLLAVRCYSAVGYFQFFPPKSCSVSLKHSEGGLIVTADRDFKAGDVIYKEYPVASVLDPDLTIRGTHCSRCLRELADSGVAAVRTDDAFPAAYCSEDCATAARVQYEALLFSLESALPPSLNLGPPASATAREARRVAQEKYIEYVQAHPEHANASVLVARFIARQATAETEKLVAKAISDDDYTDAEGSDESYSLEEHLVRLRFTLPEGAHVEQEGTLLGRLLEAAVPGFDQFVTDNRYKKMLGFIHYNSFGVYFGKDGRDGRPAAKDAEYTRSAVGTDRQVGSAFYTLSAYLPHSCAPNVRATWPAGNTQLHLVAERDIKAGEELSVAYVRVGAIKVPEKTPVVCRVRRRVELMAGWQFDCTCTRCKEEAAESSA
ncbi:MAS20-domain-containing protein [Fistulina hepatica ATCC 64428]|uniref:MAS20-domain-containing protein n=1 Tax=Fistulina hepatica ATCC 64428 TaxID=1128425 RepID=A0A0D7ALI4_9AGAR|nr:MAS20-domain-containing protein [Fistulina hepatica ATCC 64428]